MALPPFEPAPRDRDGTLIEPRDIIKMWQYDTQYLVLDMTKIELGYGQGAYWSFLVYNLTEKKKYSISPYLKDLVVVFKAT